MWCTFVPLHDGRQHDLGAEKCSEQYNLLYMRNYEETAPDEADMDNQDKIS